MILNETIVTKLETTFGVNFKQYSVGYRDALESFALALQGTIPEGLLMDALETALDAYGNNVDEDYEDDMSDLDDDFEDDGQPDERQEWFDYDHDC
jgi:hypothetical protein